MIRHVRRRGLAALPVLALAVTMIEPAFLAPLMATVGTAPLAATITLTAGCAAITVPAVAVGADEEDGLAIRGDTRPLSQCCFAVNRRHRGRRRGMDNGSWIMSGWNSSVAVHLKQGLPNQEPCRANGGVPSRLLTRYSPRGLMIGLMIGAFGADDVAAFGEKIRKLRFQMIADS
ncbi:MAG: hypothetical protein SFV51_30965 [Bryobacteraceae bacterium]|nr:hypothetical protein [Bryobacteraceae bacterium]